MSFSQKKTIHTVLRYKDLETLYDFFRDQFDALLDSNRRVNNLQRYDSLVNTMIYYLTGMVDLHANNESGGSERENTGSPPSDHDIMVRNIDPMNVRNMMMRVLEIYNEYSQISKDDFLGIAAIYLGDVESIGSSLVSSRSSAKSSETENHQKKFAHIAAPQTKIALDDKEIDMMLERSNGRTTDYGKYSGMETPGERDTYNPYNAYDKVRGLKNTYSTMYRDTGCCVDDTCSDDPLEDWTLQGANAEHENSRNGNKNGDNDNEYCDFDDLRIDRDDGLDIKREGADSEDTDTVNHGNHCGHDECDCNLMENRGDTNDRLIEQLMSRHASLKRGRQNGQAMNRRGDEASGADTDSTNMTIDDAGDINNIGNAGDVDDVERNLREIRIGVFRLLSGAAYRVFRPNYSSTKKDDPYLFDDFVELVKNTVDIVIDLKIVPRFKYRHLKQLVTIIEREYYRVCARVDHCTVHNCTPYDCERLNASERYDRTYINQSDLVNRIEDLKHVLRRAEAVASLKIKTRSSYSDMDIDALKKDIEQIGTQLCEMPYVDFMNGYSSILLKDRRNKRNSINVGAMLNKTGKLTGEDLRGTMVREPNVSLHKTSRYTPGALIRNGFWYEEFMPLLLRGIAVDPTDDHWENLIDIDEAKIDDLLDSWYAQNSFELNTHCNDVVAIWDGLTLPEKIMIKRAWDTIRDYMVTYQVRFEVTTKEERDLSQYVPFIDELLNRSYVKDQSMRLTMPLFIGPPIWTFMHSIPELMEAHSVITKNRGSRAHTKLEAIKNKIDSSKVDASNKIVGSASTSYVEYFKSYVLLFLQMYPCPYCRYHINDYVKQNHEIFNYPLEYTLMGIGQNRELVTDVFSLNIRAKLNTVHSTNDVRLFLWKFHNAVSSSVQSRNTNSAKPINSSKIITYSDKYIEPDESSDEYSEDSTADDQSRSFRSPLSPRSPKTPNAGGKRLSSTTETSFSFTQLIDKSSLRPKGSDRRGDAGNVRHMEQIGYKADNTSIRSWEIKDTYSNGYWPIPTVDVTDGAETDNTNTNIDSDLSVQNYTTDEYVQKYVEVVTQLQTMRSEFIDALKRMKSDEVSFNTSNAGDTDHDAKTSKLLKSRSELKRIIDSVLAKIHELDAVMIDSKILSSRYAVIQNELDRNETLSDRSSHDAIRARSSHHRYAVTAANSMMPSRAGTPGTATPVRSSAPRNPRDPRYPRSLRGESVYGPGTGYNTLQSSRRNSVYAPTYVPASDLARTLAQTSGNCANTNMNGISTPTTIYHDITAILDDRNSDLVDDEATVVADKNTWGGTTRPNIQVHTEGVTTSGDNTELPKELSRTRSKFFRSRSKRKLKDDKTSNTGNTDNTNNSDEDDIVSISTRDSKRNLLDRVLNRRKKKREKGSIESNGEINDSGSRSSGDMGDVREVGDPGNADFPHNNPNNNSNYSEIKFNHSDAADGAVLRPAPKAYPPSLTYTQSAEPVAFQYAQLPINERPLPKLPTDK